jgi:hypothetical protein
LPLDEGQNAQVPAQCLPRFAVLGVDAMSAFLAGRPAPPTEEWAFAARYTLKNSKGYRHTWGPPSDPVRGASGTVTMFDTEQTRAAVAHRLAVTNPCKKASR